MMKNKKILYSLLFFVLLGFTACDDDDDYDEFLASATVGIDVSEVTVFDTPFTVNFTVSNKDVTELTFAGDVSSDVVSISDYSGSLSLEDTDFGAYWALDSTVYFTSTITYSDHSSVEDFSIDVVDAITASTGGTAYEYDSTYCSFEFDAATYFNDLGTVVLQRKLITDDDSDPDFTTIYSGSEGSSYNYLDSIVGVDYSLNDTLVYQITASSGSYSETKTVEIAIVSKDLPSVSSGSLSTSSDVFHFTSEELADSVVFESTDAGRMISSSLVSFVTIDEMPEDFSSLVDVVDSSSLVASVSDLVIGDMVAYTFVYGSNAYYGILTVTDVTSASIGDSENGISFTYTQDIKYTKAIL